MKKLISLFIILILAPALVAQPPATDANAIFQKAVQNMNAKNYDEAIKGFTEVIRLSPQSSGGWVFRGISYFHKASLDSQKKLADLKSGKSVSTQYSPNSELAINDLTKVIQMFPNFESEHAILAYRFRANTYLTEGDFERALPDLKILAEKYPTNKATKDSPTFAEHYQKTRNSYADTMFGLSYKAEGEDQKKLLRKVVEFYAPKEFRHYYNRANAFYTLGEYARAISDYRSALEFEPNDVESLYGLAQSYYLAKQYESALAALDDALELPGLGMWGGSIESLRYRVYIDVGKLDIALNYYNTRINQNRAISYDYFERGRIYAKQNKKDLARADFLKAIELSKTNHLQKGKYPEAQLELDILDGKKKREDAAAKNIQKLTFERPTYPGEKIFYEGEVVNGKANGYGEATTSLKHTYKGYWKDNDFHGKGFFKFSFGDTYDGDWINGKRTGKATYIWANGSKYVGDFVDRFMQGRGILYNAKGETVYDGYFEQDKYIGKNPPNSVAVTPSAISSQIVWKKMTASNFQNIGLLGLQQTNKNWIILCRGEFMDSIRPGIFFDKKCHITYYGQVFSLENFETFVVADNKSISVNAVQNGEKFAVGKNSNGSPIYLCFVNHLNWKIFGEVDMNKCNFIFNNKAASSTVFSTYYVAKTQ